MADQLPAAQTSVVYDGWGVRIHTFTSPDAFLANSTHIIESEHALVVIDGQFVVPYAKQFRAYADSLGKPIDRVLLSHAHVDHFFGLGAAFTDVPVHALAETISYIAEHGESDRVERAQQYGPFVADRVVVPQTSIEPGTQVIDGVTYEMAAVAGCETDHQLVVHLPDLGVSIVQDLVYSGAHLYVTAHVQGWVQELVDLQSTGSTLFLAGHGPAADKAELETNAEYLRTAARILSEGADPVDYQNLMLAAYPDRTGSAIFDIYVPRLFAPAAL